jgi:hypothetical protein
MKLLHAGLLVVGAALAGGVAVRMTEPPPLPTVEPPAVPARSAEPGTVHAAPPPAPYRDPPPVTASAPPPVYAEPPHVEKPSPAPRVISPQPIQPTPKPPPVEIAAASPAPAPAPYREPPVRVVPDSEPVPTPDPVRHATLQPGADVAVRLLQTLSADRVQSGDVFRGVLAEPVIAEGLVIAERGAAVTGRVVAVQHGVIALRLLNFETADGQRLEVSTEPWQVKVVSDQSVVRFRLAARITLTERRL